MKFMTEKITQILKDLSIPTALFGAIAAFLGWRASSAYLLTFGIDPSWMEFDLIRFVVNGWVEIVLLVIIIFGLFYSDLFFTKLLIALPLKFSMWVFSVILILLLAYPVIPITKPSDSFYGFILTYAPWVAIWWFFVVSGNYIYKEKVNSKRSARSWITSIMSLVFESSNLTYLLTVVFVSMFVVNFASGRGTYLGFRDKMEDSRLPIVSVISKVPLRIPEENIVTSPNPNESFYYYPNLRLITQTKNNLFVFRLDEVDTATRASLIYIIPLGNIEIIHSRQWDWSGTQQPVPDQSGSLTPTP